MKDFLQKCALIFVSLFLCLVFTEVALKVVDYPSGWLGERMVPHPLYHHFHPPNSSYIEHMKYPPRQVRINFDSEGLNDFPRQEGKPKVIVMGDSFVEGRQVHTEELFGNKAEKMLNNLDIVNVGCSSWTSVMHYNWLKENLDKMKDVKGVYVYYFPNDPYDLMSYLKDADDPEDLDNTTFHAYFNQWNGKSRKARIWLKKNSKMYLLLTRLKLALKTKLKNKDSQSDGKFNIVKAETYEVMFDGIKTDFQKKAVKMNAEILLKIKMLLDQRGIDFTLVYIPQAQQVSREENRVGSEYYDQASLDIMFASRVHQDYLRGFTLANNVNFIDLTKELKAYKEQFPDKQLYNVSDGHFSAQGHEALAHFLVKDIQSKW